MLLILSSEDVEAHADALHGMPNRCDTDGTRDTIENTSRAHDHCASHTHISKLRCSISRTRSKIVYPR